MILATVALLAPVELAGLSGIDDLAAWAGLYLGGALWWVVLSTKPDRLSAGLALLRLWLPLFLPIATGGAVVFGSDHGDDDTFFGVMAYFAGSVPLAVM